MPHPLLEKLKDVDLVDVGLLIELGAVDRERGDRTPSRQDLAETLGCTVHTISRHLSKLVRLGYLQRERQHKTHVYRVVDERLAYDPGHRARNG